MRFSKLALEANLDFLIKEMRACYFCKDHLPFEPNPVFQLSLEARILIVGQAPGLRAHLTSLPFNDPSGVRLRQWLGVNPSQFYNSSNFALVCLWGFAIQVQTLMGVIDHLAESVLLFGIPR